MSEEYKVSLWRQFSEKYQLTLEQSQQYQRYYDLLQTANVQFDLTAITDLESIIAYHFADSLEIGNCIDFTDSLALADVGTGAGFPGLALKIKYPHLRVILIEVLAKRIQFLQSVIDDLGLQNISIYTEDWRTFLRKTDHQLDLICARASLAPHELIRMFQPSSPYKKSRLVYWASSSWKPEAKEQPFVTKVCEYTVLNRARKYVIFSLPVE